MSSGSNIYVPSENGTAFRQSEILSDVLQLSLDPDGIDFQQPTIRPVKHPSAIILSQDCDLEWDFAARQNAPGTNPGKLLPSILFCEVVTAEELRGRADINSSLWQAIRSNRNQRYHFLEQISSSEDLLGKGLPELAVDFKRYFTIPTVELHAQFKEGLLTRRSRLESPYLEHFCIRFAQYLSRIALPEPHRSQ